MPRAVEPSAERSLPRDIEDVKRIVLVGLRGWRARVWLFGSRARNDAGRASDVDVAVLPLEPVPRHVLAGIREALEESLVLYSVDLVDLSEADPALRQRVEREGIEWTS